MNKKSKKKKAQSWMKFRHRVVRNLLGLVIKPLCILKYRIKIERFKEQEDRPYLILYNHQTGFDQFFVGLTFKGPVYYLASEDIFSNGFVSSIIRYLVEPIPIKKQTTDIAAILNCMRVAREGGTIALAPEGNRTYSGRTEYMNPSVAMMAKKFKVPIAICRIEGGYGVQPRWSDVIRKGKMRAYISKVIQPEDYLNLSDDELFAIIEKELYVDEGVADAKFLSSKKAEYLERAMYVCPNCGFAHFESKGDEIRCTKCSRTVRYGDDKTLSGVGFDFPFQFTYQWYNYQKDFLCQTDVTKLTDTPVFKDRATLSRVEVYKRKEVIWKDCDISLYGDRIELCKNGETKIFPFTDITAIAVLGKNKLNVYHENQVYQFKGDKRFNALKYVNFCYRFKNIEKGDENGKFLGL